MKPLPAPRADGVTVVELSAGWIPKLFGLPFLGIGLWFFWQVPAAVVDYWRADALGQLPGQIPGLLFVVLFASVFFLPGVVLVLGRKSVELDPGRGEVREAIHYGVWTQRVTVPLAELERVVLSVQSVGSTTSRSGRAPRWYPHAELVAAGDRKVLLGLDRNAEAIRALGRGIADRLGLPLVDRLGS